MVVTASVTGCERRKGFHTVRRPFDYTALMIGELICEIRGDKPYIVRADPVIRVPAEVIHWWGLKRNPYISCTNYHEQTIFTLHGSNAKYFYRLGDYDSVTGTWELSWAD
jgi:hypothetical protein